MNLFAQPKRSWRFQRLPFGKLFWFGLALIGFGCVFQPKTHAEEPGLRLFVQWIDATGSVRVAEKRTNANPSIPSFAQPAFRALSSEEWWTGCIPIFAVERDGRFQLQRRPPPGEESLTEPIFLAWPIDGESGSSLLGTWRFTATQPGGTDASFVLQLTTEGESVAGRFDPNTEYRVADVRGGQFRTNHLELIVEHARNRYRLVGDFDRSSDRMRGRWESTEDSDRGDWVASRGSPPPAVAAVPLQPLREWKRGDGSFTYIVGTNSPGSNWNLVRTICRVCPVGASPTDHQDRPSKK